MSNLALLPNGYISTSDFDTYAMDKPVVEATVEDGVIRVKWTDGHEGRYHFIWLRDNCAALGKSIDPDSRERNVPFLDIPADVHPRAVSVHPLGGLHVIWNDGHESLYHPGWLRAYCYSDGLVTDPHRIATWDRSMAERLPTFDGLNILEDDDARYQWLTATYTYGISLLTGLPTDLETFKQVAAKIGLVRDMSRGKWFDMLSEPNGQYVSNKSHYIPPHADGPTREYFPGLQLFQCIENSCQGGESIWVDGFHVAHLMRERHPEAYHLLTTVPIQLANREPQSHYRWTTPLIVTDRHANPIEVRDIDWLRAPLMIDFDQVLPLYQAYRCYIRLTHDPANQVEYKLQPGEVAVTNNRRVLHARRAFDPTTGHRHLRLCYTEQDELVSAIRLIERSRNARAYATAHSRS